jgi:hypothetical protein
MSGVEEGGGTGYSSFKGDIRGSEVEKYADEYGRAKQRPNDDEHLVPRVHSFSQQTQQHGGCSQQQGRNKAMQNIKGCRRKRGGI